MADRKQVLVTGASGFVGENLCTHLAKQGFRVKGAVRSLYQTQSIPQDVQYIAIGNIDQNTDWSQALKGIDAVIHLAARSHVMKETASDPLAEYRGINVLGTRQLALQAAQAGVRRLIYLSSVKVNGEGGEVPYTENDAPRPEGTYGISKWEAEQLLTRIAAKTGLETVIIRPPLVYGPGVRANFLRLLGMVNKNIPLPLSMVNNKRSMIYIGNLVDAIIRCIEHPDAVNKTFLVSDGQDISTPDLIRMIAGAMGKTARLFPCPVSLLKMIGNVAGKGDEIERLIGSLRIDSAKIRRELNWTPPFTMEQELSMTANWFISNEKNI